VIMWCGMPSTCSVGNGGNRRELKCLRSEMSSKSKIFERRFDGISGEDARRNASSGCEFFCGCGRTGDDENIAVEAVAGSKVCRLGAGSGSPFTVRARGVDDCMGVTGDKSFRTDGSRRGCPGFWDGENERWSFGWG